MREILFRGRRTDNGGWVEGFFYQHPLTKECFVVVHDYNSYSIAYMGNLGCPVFNKVVPATVGQYTGLKDQNGKRIFEGDVVVQYTAPVGRWPERYGKRYCVDMDTDRRGWWPFACGDGCGCCEEDTISPCDCKVLGNIHDNPELMEV